MQVLEGETTLMPDDMLHAEAAVQQQRNRKPRTQEDTRRYAGDLSKAGDISLAGSAGTAVANTVAHAAIINSIMGEYADIAQNPERFKKNLKDMKTVLDNHYEQTGNPIENIILSDLYAAYRDPITGDDSVWIIPEAPQPSHMAHELGHVTLFHSDGPMGHIQRNPLSRSLAAASPIIGGLGAFAGASLSQKRRLAGAAMGGVVGTGLSSFNTAYEAAASHQGMDYLPEDYAMGEYLSDVVPAAGTYAMAGPGRAAMGALGVTGAMYGGNKLSQWMRGESPRRY